MKTLTRRSNAPSTTPGTRLRQLCAVAVVVPALTLTACSGESPVTADPTAPATTASAAATTSTTPPTTSATPTGTPSTTATDEPTSGPRVNSAVGKTFTDRGMGHAVTVGTVSRDIPWPKGNPVSEDAFEIVGVYVKARAGARYSATIEPSMFALATKTGLVEPTTQFGATLGKPLPVAKRGSTTEGWLFFKVDRGAEGPTTLYLRRPAYAVSTTGATLPATRYGVQITK